MDDKHVPGQSLMQDDSKPSPTMPADGSDKEAVGTSSSPVPQATGQTETAAPHSLAKEDTPNVESVDDTTTVNPETTQVPQFDLPAAPAMTLQDYVTQGNITVDNLDVDSTDSDSSLGDIRIPQSTTSVRSSVYDSVQENGRTYHRYKEGGYFLPNDELEQERLDLQHHLFGLTLQGRLYLAPIKPDVQDVLDIATGTGIWAIEFAVEHPSASIIGTDLSPIQPEFVPPNLTFEIDDAEDPWIYSHPFDYIHGRLLATCFKNFPGVVDQAFNALRPGGYLELQDIVPTVCYDNSWDGTDYKKWIELCVEGGKKLGMDWEKATKYKRYMEEAGFVDVTEVHFAWPSNPWPRGKHFKTLGRWAHQNWLDGMQGISIATLTRGLGMTPTEVEVLLVGVRESLKDKRLHCYTPVIVIYGRKPE